VLQDILPLTEDISYSDIYGTTQSQIDFVRIYEQYLVLRDKILEDTDPQASIPAIYAGPRHHQTRRPPVLGKGKFTGNVQLGAAPLVQHYSVFSAQNGLGYLTLIHYYIIIFGKLLIAFI
jgi:hypothetical protein